MVRGEVRFKACANAEKCGNNIAHFLRLVRSGLFMGVMACMILPLNLSLASERNFTERGVIKTALEIARYSLALMVNYQSIFFFLASIAKGRSPWTNPSIIYNYDGLFGAPKYILSLVIIFSCMVVAESVTLILVSKVQFAPRQMKKYTTDSSFMVIFTSAMARLVGDLLIYALQNRPLLHELVNPLCFTLMAAFTVGLYILKRHYFFLI